VTHPPGWLRRQAEAIFDGIARRDPSPMQAALADDVVMEFPLDAASPPLRLQGRAAVVETMERLRAAPVLSFYSPPRIFVDEGAGVAIVEAAGELQVTPEAARVAIIQVVVLEFQEGRLVSWRDYRATRAPEQA
jgi:ketosteroid isomerase-like protein